MLKYMATEVTMNLMRSQIDKFFGSIVLVCGKASPSGWLFYMKSCQCVQTMVQKKTPKVLVDLGGKREEELIKMFLISFII